MEHLVPDDVESTEPVDGIFASYLVEGERMSAQSFEMEPGAAIPEHDHHHEQFGFIYEGEVTFHLEDGDVVVTAGEGFLLDGGEPHSVENTGETVARGVDVFSPPRPEDYWSE